MTVRHPVVYLPSEIHNRDWEARLLLADHVTSLGVTAVVGQQWVIHAQENIEKLPPGLILVKTINEIQLNVAAAFTQNGHIVAAMDEEGLAVAPDQGFLGILSPRLARLCDFFYANSPLHEAAIQQLLPTMQGKVIAAGNARLDLLVPPGRTRFAAEAEKIKSELGPFVLFNSNLAQENSIWDDKKHYEQIQILAGGLNLADPASVERYRQQFEFERTNTEAFKNALTWCLENIPSHRCVVRPHPVERSDIWQKLADRFPRLHIAGGGHHVPWMMAADAVVHTNSTTGVEAAFLERATVNLVPNATGHWENIYVATRVNPTFTDWRDGVAALSEFLSTGGGRLSQLDQERSELRRYFPHAFDGRAAERIAKHMVSTLRQAGLSPEPFDIADMVREKLQHFERGEPLRWKFTKGFSEALGDFKAIRQVTGLRHDISVAKISESCFAIIPK